jgi:hypothetical protein
MITMNDGSNIMELQKSKGYAYRIDRNRRVEISRVGPDAIMAHISHRDSRGTGHTYLFEAKDREGVNQGTKMEAVLVNLTKLLESVNERDSKDSASDRWKRHMKRSILLVATCSRTINKKMLEIYQREGIECPAEDLPRIRKLVIRLFTIPEPEHVLSVAKERKIGLSNEDVAKVCWGIRAFERTLDEFREKGWIE